MHLTLFLVLKYTVPRKTIMDNPSMDNREFTVLLLYLIQYDRREMVGLARRQVQINTLFIAFLS